jgi:Phage integrase family
MGRMRDLPRVRFHDLRHSHATQLLASGVRPKIAAERLGNASVGITLDLYSHVTDTMQSDVAAKLDRAMQLAKSRVRTETRVTISVARSRPTLALAKVLLKYQPHMATWRSGYATVCKTVYPGSIPGVASNN